ncbi:sugar epimerase [Leptolyngbya boryana NIES-2135]|jgi:dihydroflavonol-4-reductase|uniref:Sugar epimerase n=1 Tax=Leptolyngbya boryana NIES-2135 TaxID=1973484 RepID=A0A1Z4JDE9_LEPBY|nr:MULTISPECIES: hopanoid-associated sugar epimerase [Leptolyngbya]BAY54792.1 sugar epimerase [Leptolyngbya boryana NIES-2135]MBD2365775.1 NAD-dependent epimerase/dehydratase family protein [Leptolyngbya sp. FACHB-161]MBD2371955.1 NAD-dependent epimerase/dehydratase family protein [Leptolyngbya sp. FACHB-238]MBD2396380.1 NAD-dependent epimerase/dehydratase family protein [Leptolyngbya sp. FACHB-239]MBD2402902.1 NAD-dependent epimerase/dehydratase family protein [Leptolyngbya sp. FACHB-402]
MKAFVTGGTGFVGANLVRLLLQQGYEVKALARSNARLDNLNGLEIELISGDLNDPDLARSMQGCDCLFHVAAHYSLWQRDRDLLYQSNVLGTRNVLAAAKAAGIGRSVYTSSVAAIGIDPSGQPTTEQYQSPVEKLIGEYKQSKYWAEQEAVKAAQLGQDVVIVNPSTPIGAYDIKPTPTGDIVVRFLERRMPTYVETGLNFVHVQDVAWGHLLALQKGKSGERYILGNQNLSLKQLLDELSQITGLSAPARSIPVWIPLSVAWIDETILTKFGKKPSIPVDGVRMSKQPMYYDASKAIRELGLPQTPIHIALKDAVDWFQENLIQTE